MSRRGARPIIYVCGNVSSLGELIMEAITAPTQNEAISIFKEKFNMEPKNILGPFYQKRKQVLHNMTCLKFTTDCKKAEYEGWKVNAIRLAEPANHAYLVFLERIDNKEMSRPTGTIVVPYSSLRII